MCSRWPLNIYRQCTPTLVALPFPLFCSLSTPCNTPYQHIRRGHRHKRAAVADGAALLHGYFKAASSQAATLRNHCCNTAHRIRQEAGCADCGLLMNYRMQSAESGISILWRARMCSLGSSSVAHMHGSALLNKWNAFGIHFVALHNPVNRCFKPVYLGETIH